MDPSFDPEKGEPVRPEARSRQPRSEGMGVIISVVAVTALIILGMLCIMRPVEAPGTVTSEAPSPTAPPSKQ